MQLCNSSALLSVAGRLIILLFCNYGSDKWNARSGMWHCYSHFPVSFHQKFLTLIQLKDTGVTGKVIIFQLFKHGSLLNHMSRSYLKVSWFTEWASFRNIFQMKCIQYIKFSYVLVNAKSGHYVNMESRYGSVLAFSS